MEKSLNNTKAAILLILDTIAAICISFVYIHWTAYKIAAGHTDYEQLDLPVFVCILALVGIIFFRKKNKQDNRNLYKYLAIFSLVIMLASGLTAVLSIHACCPACNYVHDKWYSVFYRIFNGTEYDPM